MALTKKRNVFHSTICPCQIENMRPSDTGMIIPDTLTGTLTRMTPGRSTMNTIKARAMTTAGRVANIRTILMITGTVLEITGMSGIAAETTAEIIGRITGIYGMIDITLLADHMLLTICTGHTLNIGIKVKSEVGFKEFAEKGYTQLYVA